MKTYLALRLAPASAALLLAFPLAAAGDSAASAVAEGNRQYAGGKYDEAILNYQKALQELPESPQVFFNLGAAEYQKKNYEQAGKLFGRSIALSDSALQAQAAYNLGGTLYREGKLIESLAAFKKAIEIDPRDADAKFNYEFVSLKLKEQEQKPPPPKPEEQQDQKKPEEQKQDEQSAAPQPSPSPAVSPPPPEPRQEMNRDEAERMLDALKAEEEEQREEQAQEKPREIPEVLKDW